MPLLFRESPLNSIWEGSGNVNALDVLRALSREPEALNAWIVEVGRARGEDPRLDRAIDDVLESLADTAELEVGARRLAGRDGRLPAGRAARAARPRRGRRRVLRHPARHGVRRHARHPRPRAVRPAPRSSSPRPPPVGLIAEWPARRRASGHELEARVERVLVEHLGRGGLGRGRRRRRPGRTSPWTGAPALVVPGVVFVQHVDDQLGDLVELVVRRSRGWSAPGCRAGCRRCTRRRSGRPGPSCGW